MVGHIVESVRESDANSNEGHSVLLLSVIYTSILITLQLFCLPAISVDGIIHCHIKVGGYNRDEFIEYLKGLLSIMNPYPAPHSVLVIDNCHIHHIEGVEELCAAQ